MNNENETFNRLFNYYISSINYEEYRYLYNTEVTLERDYTMYKIIAFIAALLMLLTSIILFTNKKNVTNNVISKEDKLKYIDPMTSLKNRNYLNANIYKWDDNVIFPQSVVVFDLNSVRDVNDKLGREAGDEIIKKVASILINNQLENTDIIRSGGDEFLIYMIGYNENQVDERQAIATAVSAVQDGLVRIFQNDKELTNLDERITFVADDIFTFVKLTMLSGRMW